jgi:hypothetical protein
MQKKESDPQSLLRHPFVVILGGIIIAYGGCLFGVRLYELLH